MPAVTSFSVDGVVLLAFMFALGLMALAVHSCPPSYSLRSHSRRRCSSFWRWASCRATPLTRRSCSDGDRSPRSVPALQQPWPRRRAASPVRFR
ncbi:hypothetical protein PF010_g32632 [Phytophthora fragariae]|uniref:Uncharacterized protein n=1 Tax=Phytophthora fragariae TaxID=53985 RepID=A0A6G0JEF3_9STRA|nr:hypothetical protein PF003_g28959 [Phytophthora fragariae]KAE9054214.1 hypothetical protein PF010_g32632 [Phytophthora fragariae]